MAAATIHQPTRATDPRLIERLRGTLTSRNIQEGFALLEANHSAIDRIGPGQPRSAVLAGYVAQWVDAGFAKHRLIKELLARFPERGRAWLSVEEFAHLQMAQGIVHLSEEESDRGLSAFGVILSLAPYLEDLELVAMAHFGQARCLRRKGEYSRAYTEVVIAREMTEALGYRGLAAVVATLESWILFRRGKLKEAAALLENAETVLAPNDDFLTLGNIQSAFGRLAQHEGRYQDAIERFNASITHYSKRNPEHPNVARSLANMGYVERLLALQMKKRIDAEAEQRRGSGPNAKSSMRERFEKLRRQALQHLALAGEIFEKTSQHHGEGTVRVTAGFLHLDSGEFDIAAAMASQAFHLGKDKEDYILMARARLLQNNIENARLEEMFEGEDPEQHAHAAVECAREAIEYARKTDHTRLLARAQLALGVTYCSDELNDLEGAKTCCDAAAALLKSSESFDPLWDEVRVLRRRITHTTGLEGTLKAWSQGELGGKTLQQMTEDFAGFIIPRVWEQEERKVSRVAARLSVSPKKVRRILSRAGLLHRSDP